MKPFFFILVFVLTPALAFSQSIERSVIGTTGNYTSTATLRVSGTAGEAVIGSASTTNLIVTEGFQQPDGMAATGVNHSLPVGPTVSVYPNPASDRIYVKIGGGTMTLAINIYNSTGQLVQQHSGWHVHEHGRKELDFSAFAIGDYLIELKSADGLMKRAIKVQKTH